MVSFFLCLKTRIVKPPEAVAEAAACLASGELVALPTETVYGLGASALDPLACAKIFEAKERPLSDPLIVHLPSLDWLDRLAAPTKLAMELAEAFWPGPLTIVLPRHAVVPDLVTAGQETVALRMSAHPVFRQVASAFGGPIAAPSANRFGRISPTTARHVSAELDGRIPLIVDGGPCAHGIESTIVLLREGGMEILRHGPITQNQLTKYGEIFNPSEGIASPGFMKSHYAPGTPMRLLPCEHAYLPERTGLLAWEGFGDEVNSMYSKVEWLSPTGDLREAAANLYSAMRRLDEAGLDFIIAEPVPEQGLGVAIMDRLRKAAARE